MGQQTKKRKRTRIGPDRRQRLEALPGWTWDIISDQWEDGFFHLKSFQNGRDIAKCPTASRLTMVIGLASGSHSKKNAGQNGPERRQRLEALPGWSWDVLSDAWEEGFAHLKQFSDREKHCRVTMDYRTEDGHRLGQWVKVQRRTKDKMDPDRRQRLEALPGWVWKVEK